MLELCRQLWNFQQHKHNRQEQQENRGHGVGELCQQAGDNRHGGIRIDIFKQFLNRDFDTRALQPWFNLQQRVAVEERYVGSVRASSFREVPR